MQPVHAEKSFGIHPYRARRETRAYGQFTQAIDGELVRVLGVQGFALLEVVARPAPRYGLAHPADQMHLYALLRGVVERAVVELVENEARAQFAVGARQQ